MDDLQKSRRCTVPVERQRVSQQLKKHDAGGENIGSRIDRLSIYLLRRHISQAADQLTGASDGLIPDVSNSEVHDFHAAVLEHHDVAGFDVTMNNPVVVRIGQPLTHVANEIDLCQHGQRAARVDDGVEVSPSRYSITR